MSVRKKYSKEFKLDAISLVLDQNYSQREAAGSLDINPNMLGMGTQHKEQKKLFGIPLAVPIGMGAYQKDFRVHQIKDEKTKKLFIELANEYDKLSHRLSTIKIRLSWISGGSPFEPPNADSWDEF